MPEPDARWAVSIADLLDRRCAQTPAAVMAHDESGRTITFGELDERCRSVATELAALGVDGSSRVAWQLPTWIETLVLMCALTRLQATQVPLPYAYRAHEVSAAVEQTQADLLITPSRWRGFDFAAMAVEVAARCPGLATATLDRGAWGDAPWFTSAARAASPPIELRARVPFAPDVRWIFFTSGTAGAPKGAQHTDRTVTVPATTMADAFELVASDRSAVAFPLGHVGGVNWLVACLQTGCRLLLAERLVDTTIDAFDAQQVTLAGVSTAFHLAYRDRARAQPGRALFAHVRAYPGGGAPKPPTLHGELRHDIGGLGIVSGYGLTECPMIGMSTVRDPDAKLAVTEGRPSPGVEFETRNPATGELRATGTTGEIWVRAPQLFLGYVDPAATRAAMDERGFFRTGDLGHLDADGYVVVSGRLKDVIIRKGENISAKEVEDHVCTHPDVADVVVVGLPDERVGERCCAVIVTKSDRSVPTVDELGEHLRNRGLMTQKWPEQIAAVAELPRNAAGKVRKQDLIRELSTLSH